MGFAFAELPRLLNPLLQVLKIHTKPET